MPSLSRFLSSCFALLFILLGSAANAAETERGWDYYRTILESGLFPKLAPETVTTRQPDPIPMPPNRWWIDYRISAVYEPEDDGEILIAVQNIKTQRNFLLRQGESDFQEKLQFVRCQTTKTPIIIEVAQKGVVRAFEFPSHDPSLRPEKTK